MPPPSSSAHPAGTAVRGAVLRLAEGGDLAEEVAETVFGEIMSGEVPAPLVAELLLGLRQKGETGAEVAGAVRALRGAMRRVAHPRPDQLVDTCGTGGGAIATTNISTAAAFVAAGAGAMIAKHGNRSYTSRSGSADVLEALGIAIEVEPEHAARVLDRVGIVFLYAPTYHPAMRHVAPVRRQLGVATIMNLVGPLANPAGAGRQVVGVGNAASAPVMAGALARLGAVHALVLHAALGMDEISPVGTTAVWEVRDGQVHEWEFDPGTTGAGATSLAGLEGGEPHDNARLMVDLLERPAAAAPALRAAVVLNAAAAIYVAGLAASLDDAVHVAAEALESGKARERLEGLRRAAPA